MLNILIVDDEVDLEALLNQKFRRKIHKKEWKLSFARDGQEAFEFLKKINNIDIVLSDINMPNMDGLTLTKKIREEGFDVKTIVVSAYGDLKNIRTAMANGACDFITKPIDFTDMEETINRSFSVLKSSRNALQSREEFVLLKKELNIARDIQKSILPVNFDIETSCKLQARMEPAKEVGGDFYDFFKLGQDHLAMVVADVSGKGISAAVFALINQIKLRSLAGIQKDFSTAKLLEELNSQCCKNNDNCMFITMFYGILNIKTGLLTYTNAGHNPPVLADPSGSCTTLAFTKDTSLGIVEGISYSEKTIQLSKNSVLFIYTDGLTEAMNTQGEEFGEEQLMKELSGMEKQNLEQINSQIYATVKKFEGEAPQFDDLTYLIIKKETD